MFSASWLPVTRNLSFRLHGFRALKSICYFKIKFNEFFDASWAIVWTSPTFKVDPIFVEAEYRVFSWEKFLISWNNQLIKKYNWRNKEKCKIELIFILLHYNVSRSRYVLLFLLCCFFFDFVKKKKTNQNYFIRIISYSWIYFFLNRIKFWFFKFFILIFLY